MYKLTRIKDFRISIELRQKDVASKMGITQQQYSRYETGEDEMKIGTFVAICKTLNVSADYLLGFTDTPKSINQNMHLIAARSKDNKPKEWREIDAERIKNAPETDEDL